MRRPSVPVWMVLLGLGLALTGCAAVEPYEREYLSDRIMASDQEAFEDKLEQKWLAAREGSTGGAGGAGGGCACN